jgi:hypothetical protein
MDGLHQFVLEAGLLGINIEGYQFTWLKILAINKVVNVIGKGKLLWD